MRIAIDARELVGRPTGVGRYLASLLAEWGTLPAARGHSFILYGPAAAGAARPAIPAAPGQAMSWRGVAGRGGTWWEQVQLATALRRDRPDVFFAPAYTAPIVAPMPVVLTIHDLSFLAHPKWFRPREGFRRRWVTRMAAASAARVLTDTEFSKREIMRLLGLPPERIQAIPLGVPAPRGDRPPDGAADLTGGDRSEGGRLILFAGSILNRRRVPDLVRAFAIVARAYPDVRLAIVGDNRTYPFEDLEACAVESGAADRIAIHGYVSDELLTALYRKATVFAFLSEYEGFGLPPLEALSNGVPIVVLETEVAREVYREAAIYVRKGDLKATSDALSRLLADQSLRTSVLSRAPEVLERFSWPRTARETLAALERAAQPKKGSGTISQPISQRILKIRRQNEN